MEKQLNSVGRQKEDASYFHKSCCRVLSRLQLLILDSNVTFLPVIGKASSI